MRKYLMKLLFLAEEPALLNNIELGKKVRPYSLSFLIEGIVYSWNWWRCLFFFYHILSAFLKRTIFVSLSMASCRIVFVEVRAISCKLQIKHCFIHFFFFPNLGSEVLCCQLESRFPQHLSYNFSSFSLKWIYSVQIFFFWTSSHSSPLWGPINTSTLSSPTKSNQALFNISQQTTVLNQISCRFDLILINKKFTVFLWYNYLISF